MPSIRIMGTGSYLPPAVLTNYDLEKSGLETTHDWIVQRTGVSERRIAGENETTSDLGCGASLKALEMAGMSPRDVDLIIVPPSPRTLAVLRPPIGCRPNWKLPRR